MKKYNNADTTLAGDLGGSGTSFVVNAGEGALFPATGFPYDVTVEHYTGSVVTKREILTISGRVGDAFTISARHSQTCVQDDSAIPKTRTANALSFLSGDRVYQTVTENDFIEVYENLQADLALKFDKTGGALTGVLNEKEGANFSSASTVNLATATGNTVHITGTNTIFYFGTVAAGTIMNIIFDGACTLKHDLSYLHLPGNADILCTAGDSMIIESKGSNNWHCISYQKDNGQAVIANTDIVGATEDTAPDLDLDYILTYDASAGSNKKTKLSNAKGLLGGTGADGALTISSGTTILTLVNDYIEKNYSSISISGTAILDITGISGDNGGVAYIKCSGNLTMSAGTIQMNGQGGKGGTGAPQNAGAATDGSQGKNILGTLLSKFGVKGASASFSGGAGGVAIVKNPDYFTLSKILNGVSGGGGGGGGSPNVASTQGGAGGRGGGILIIEVGGAINFTGGTIQANGAAGTAGSGSGGGGGGGGAGGTIICVYRTQTSIAGTMKCDGGNGGAGSGSGGGAGGGGGGYITAGGAGGASIGASGTAGTSGTYGTGGSGGTGAGGNTGGGGGGTGLVIKQTAGIF